MAERNGRYVTLSSFNKGQNLEFSESSYDLHNFSLDTGHDRNIWHLWSTANHLTRSKELYRPTVISKIGSNINMYIGT